MANSEAVPKLTPDVVSNIIQEWMLQDQWNVRKPDNIPHTSLWALTAMDEFQRGIVIAQSRNIPDLIEITATVAVSEEHAERMSDLSEEEREEFLWDIRFRLLANDIDFAMRGAPLENITTGDRIYIDGLTKHSFFQAVRRVRRSMIMIIAMIHKLFREVPQEEQFRGLLPFDK